MLNQVYHTLGQNEPGTNYPLKTEITALVMDAKAVEYSKSSGKPGQSLYLKDDDGDIAWVKLTGQFDPLTKGQRCTFKVWPYKPPNSPKTYLYCWLQNSPQSTPATAQDAPQSTNPPQGMTGEAEILDVLYRILAAIKDLQPFEKKYDLEQPEYGPDDDTAPF